MIVYVRMSETASVYVRGVYVRECVWVFVVFVVVPPAQDEFTYIAKQLNLR